MRQLMKICVFASGSGGNCLLVSDGDTRVLVDAGISRRRIESSLACLGLTMQDISGVLVTHEHSDHVSGLKMLLARYELPLYAPHTVGNRLCGFLPEAERVLRVIPVGAPFRVGGLGISAFHTPHDTDESVGYRIEGSTVFAIATDLGTVTEEVRHGLTGAEIALIEANHDVDMLRYGPYPVQLKRRILSEHGHLSNTDCAVLAEELFRTGTREIVLGHISKKNNTPDTALRTVAERNPGYREHLRCAPEFGMLVIESGV